jgi:hypothetical protein
MKKNLTNYKMHIALSELLRRNLIELSSGEYTICHKKYYPTTYNHYINVSSALLGVTSHDYSFHLGKRRWGFPR